MNRWLKRVLWPQRGPLLTFWKWLHRHIDPHLARALSKSARNGPAIMGVPLLIMGGNEESARARIAQALEYVARSPRHLSRLRRTLAMIGVGAPTIRHGRYVPELGACHLATHELHVHSIPALAATLVHAVTEARLRRAVFDRRTGTPEELQRLPLLCARASTDFLDRAQAWMSSGLTSA
jgi:hypothetical protein